MTNPAYEPNDIYVVEIYNHSGELYQIVRQWDRLEFSQRLNDPWNHTLQVRVSPDDPNGELFRSLVKDYFVIIKRFDVVTQTTDVVYEGLHATSREQTQTDGNIFFQLYGGGYTKFLERRLVLPPPGQENSVKTGSAETVIKDYVYESCVSPTGLLITDNIALLQVTSFIDNSRVIQGLTIAPSLDTGNIVEYSARFTNLNSVVSKLADDGQVYYGIYGGDELGEFIFDVRPLWGKDRRVGNSAGNAPAVFSLERGNMLIPILATNNRHEKNFIFAGGTGQGSKRVIAQAYDGESINGSPWGRSELYIDSRKEDYAGTYAAAAGAIQSRGTKESFDFDIKNTRNSRWLRDWELGDYITAYYRGRTFEKMISEVTVIVSPSGQQKESISVDLEEITEWEQVYQAIPLT